MDQVSMNKCDDGSKRHGMVLSIAPKSTSVFTDQTPTPTRLIRKCEEVGLFQDLQNVNPFEETFRKAVEAVRTGSTPLQASSLSLPSNNADDTLHTPNLFPNGTEHEISASRQSENPLGDKECGDSDEHVQLSCDEQTPALQSRSFSSNLINVLETCTTERVNDQFSTEKTLENQKTVQILICTPNGKETLNVGVADKSLELTSKKTDDSQNQLDWTQELQICNEVTNVRSNTSNSQEKITSVKNKLKQTLMKNNEQQNPSRCAKKNAASNDSNNNDQQKQITAKKLLLPPVSSHYLPSKRKGSSELNFWEDSSSPNEKKDKLEKNRASAMRCRAKRKKMMEEIKVKCNQLTVVNQHLQSEISNLRAEIAQLQTLLLAHRNCPVTEAMVQQGTVEKSKQVITFTLPSVITEGEKTPVPFEKTKLTIRMVDGLSDESTFPVQVLNKFPKKVNTSSIFQPSNIEFSKKLMKNVPLRPKEPFKNSSVLDVDAVKIHKPVATHVIQVNPNITAKGGVR